MTRKSKLSKIDFHIFQNDFELIIFAFNKDFKITKGLKSAIFIYCLKNITT